ncbi:hypothetical protein N7462_008132 [Penicillium macrosclerotiorum]|uniref:uncharacterized protein n=1 Tax=Penicillium macrosclerotiorum TaxID=303699 RepID=UPI0025484862|nr:uncharacterized protein N7462_008132 [Penicillium macrosclerotiorum]KAJ5679888.1 hypothetical protein N7462_008132 [Penicillium macrosclerotiorum]
MRLQGLEQRSTTSKNSLLASVADDIGATFISIANHANAGNLDDADLGPFENVARIIHQASNVEQQVLKSQVQRLKRGNRGLRREYQKLYGFVERLGREYDGKLLALKDREGQLQTQVKDLKADRELWRLHIGLKPCHIETKNVPEISEALRERGKTRAVDGEPDGERKEDDVHFNTEMEY